MGRLDVRDPVADRLARRLLQRLRAEVDAAHLGAEQPHPLDVGTLAAHVLFAHVDDAVEAEARADRRGGDAVLAGAGLGDDPLLAEPPREHRLAERVVQLVRAGVEEVLALEVDALPGCEALGERERRGAARVRRQQVVELGAEGVVGERLAPAALQLVERRDQRLGDVAAAVVAEVAHARASSHERLHLGVVLDPGSGLELRRRVHRPGLHGADRLAHVVRPEPAGEHEAVVAARAFCQWSGSSPSQGRSATRATGSPSRSRTASRPRTRALLALVELDEVRALLLGLADEDGDAQHGVRHREDLGRLARRALRRR